MKEIIEITLVVALCCLSFQAGAGNSFYCTHNYCSPEQQQLNYQEQADANARQQAIYDRQAEMNAEATYQMQQQYRDRNPVYYQLPPNDSNGGADALFNMGLQMMNGR